MSEKIVTFIRDTFKKSGKSTAVIAVSGGIDSATSLMLTAQALSPTSVHAYYLPSKSSSPISESDARAAATAANLPETNFHLIPIQSIIQKSWRSTNKKREDSGFQRADMSKTMRALQNRSERELAKLRLANLAARIRMMVIFDQAKKLDAMVVGTENYSEHLLGYFTRFGDEASDLEPIRHLYKTQVIELAISLKVPQSIITKSPTADLWKGQTDAAELGFTYAEADPILELIDKQKISEEIIAAGFSESLVTAVIKQVNSARFKHQVPYSLKLVDETKSEGLDF